MTRGLNIHYKDCIGSLIYLLSKIVDLSFAVHKLEKFSSNPGKGNFEGLVHLLGTLGKIRIWVKYYADMKDATLSDMLGQDNIKTKNQLMAFSD